MSPVQRQQLGDPGEAPIEGGALRGPQRVMRSATRLGISEFKRISFGYNRIYIYKVVSPAHLAKLVYD